MNRGAASENVADGAGLRETGALSELLREAGRKLAALSADFEADRTRLADLLRRLREERCYLAVLGQFKRGKSTLVNALLGEPVLPAAVVPLTSIPTFLYGGERLAARVQFENGRAEEHLGGADAGALAEFLSRFVTESANPHNRLGVRSVEATYPAPILRQGLALIDTPGIGSTFRHNTEATINFLPQCDAALFVVSADPPITEVEVEFLKLARRKVTRLFFVLNKVDYLDAGEAREAVAFLQRVLAEQVGLRAPVPICCASARRGLAARQSRDVAAWQRSGMAELERQIVGFLLTEKAAVLRRALARQAADVLADARQRLELTVRYLRLPQAELDERMRRFEESLTRIDEQRIVAVELLRRDEEHLAGAVRKRADQLLPQTRAFLLDVMHACEQREGPQRSEDSTRAAIAAAIPGYCEREFGAVPEACAEQLRAALLPHRRRAGALIASVRQRVEELFDLPPQRREPEIALATAKRPCWRTHKWTIRFGAIPETWIDRLVPRRWRHNRIRRRLGEQVEYLVTRNVGDLQWSMLENLAQSVQSFLDQLDAALQDSIQATRRALDAARRRRTADAATAAPEIARLEAAAAGLGALAGALCQAAETEP